MSAPIFLKQRLVTDGSLNAAYISPAMPISGALDFGVQLVWSGSPAGTFAVQVSNDADALSSDLTTSLAATWNSLTLSAVPTASGAAGSWYVDVATLSAEAMRINYTSTLVETFTYVTVADVSGSLNNTYFLFSSVEGVNYYVWYNVNSAGVDPALPGKTGIEVDLATNAANTTVATSTGTAIQGATSITIEVTGHTGVCTQDAVGHATAASAGTSGFTVTNQIADSLLQVKVTGKGT